MIALLRFLWSPNKNNVLLIIKLCVYNKVYKAHMTLCKGFEWYLAAVILMEGGSDEDLKVLEEPDDDLDSSRGRKDSESADKRWGAHLNQLSVTYLLTLVCTNLF